MGYLVHEIARLMKRRFEEEARVHGITLPQWRVLAQIALNEGITPGGAGRRDRRRPDDRIGRARLVAVSDGLLESAYLDGPKQIAALIQEALARILVPR